MSLAAEKVGILDARSGGLGLKVTTAGGKARISEIVAGGQAEVDSSISLGDVIVSVNYVDMHDKDPIEIISALKTAKGVIALGLNVDSSPILEDESQA